MNQDAIPANVPDSVKLVSVWLLALWHYLGTIPAEQWVVYVSLAYTALLALHRLYHFRHPPGGKGR